MIFRQVPGAAMLAFFAPLRKPFRPPPITSAAVCPLKKGSDPFPLLEAQKSPCKNAGGLTPFSTRGTQIMQLDEQAVEGIIRLADTLEQGITRKKPDLLHSLAQPVKVAES
jgi:hypothetical protein